MLDKRLGVRVFGNAGILVSTQVITKLLGAILAIAAARMLGVADYGLYMFATTLGLLFGLVAGLGLAQLVPREVARNIDKTGQVFGEVLVLESVLMPAALVMMAATLFWLGYPPDRVAVVTVIGATMLLNSTLNVVTAFFRAHQRMALEAVTRIVFSVLNVSLSLLILLGGWGIFRLAQAQLAAFGAGVALALFLITRKLARPRFSLRWDPYRRLLLAAWPFALSGIFIFIYDGTAPVFVSFLKGDDATGLYSGALNFIRIFDIIPAGISAAVLPAMAQLWPNSPGAWTSLCRYTLKYLLIMAFPLAIGLAMLSGKLIAIVLGAEYAASALILRLATLVMLIVFLNHGLTIALISTDKEKTFLRIVGLALVVNVLANVVLIRRWGAPGAVASSLLTEGLILITQYAVLVRAGLQLKIMAAALRPAASGAVMALVVYLTGGFGLVVPVLSGAAVYVFLLFALRTFESAEIEQMHLAWSEVFARLAGRMKRKPVRT